MIKAAQANIPANPRPNGVCKNINSGGGASEDGTAVVSKETCDCEVAITGSLCVALLLLVIAAEVTSVDMYVTDSLVEVELMEVAALSAAIYKLLDKIQCRPR